MAAEAEMARVVDEATEAVRLAEGRAAASAHAMSAMQVCAACVCVRVCAARKCGGRRESPTARLASAPRQEPPLQKATQCLRSRL